MCGAMHWFIPPLHWSYIGRSSTIVEGIRFVNKKNIDTVDFLFLTKTSTVPTDPFFLT